MAPVRLRCFGDNRPPYVLPGRTKKVTVNLTVTLLTSGTSVI
jgi:hypothetical protein